MTFDASSSRTKLPVALRTKPWISRPRIASSDLRAGTYRTKYRRSATSGAAGQWFQSEVLVHF